MIFYLAIDNNNQTKIVGTQADAKALNPQFEQIDIPVDKAGLMAWIQQMLDETLNAQDEAQSYVSQPLPETMDDVEDILNELIGLGGGDMTTIKEYAERIAALVPEVPEPTKPKVHRNAQVAEILTALEVGEFIETVGEKRLQEIELCISVRRNKLNRTAAKAADVEAD